eukprot:4121958-Alexandrium_andersonii.AAC.1
MNRSTLVRSAEWDGSRFVIALYRPAAHQSVYIWTWRALKNSSCASCLSLTPIADEDEAAWGNSEEGKFDS